MSAHLGPGLMTDYEWSEGWKDDPSPAAASEWTDNITSTDVPVQTERCEAGAQSSSRTRRLRPVSRLHQNMTGPDSLELSSILKAPTHAVAVAEGAFIVSDNRNNRLIYSEAGEPLRTIGSEGAGAGAFFDGPFGVTLDGLTLGNERLYVADCRNNRILVFGLSADCEVTYQTSWNRRTCVLSA